MILKQVSSKETGPREPKLTRVDLAYDDFEGQYITVDQADEWDDVGGFWCGGRQPKIEKIGPSETSKRKRPYLCCR